MHTYSRVYFSVWGVFAHYMGKKEKRRVGYFSVEKLGNVKALVYTFWH